MQHPVTYHPTQYLEGEDACEVLDLPDLIRSRTGHMRESEAKTHHLVVAFAPFSKDHVLLPERGQRYSLEHDTARKLNREGIVLRSNVVLLDFDLPKKPDGSKQPWAELTQEQQQAYHAPLKLWAQNTAPHFIYFTRHGVRIVLLLPRSILLGIDGAGYEQLLADLAASVTAATGLILDRQCLQWWHLFRLPFKDVHIDEQLDIAVPQELLERIAAADATGRAQLAEHAAQGYPLVPKKEPREQARAVPPEALAELPERIRELLKTDLSSLHPNRSSRGHRATIELAPYTQDEDTIFDLLAPIIEGFELDGDGKSYLSKLRRQIRRALDWSDDHLSRLPDETTDGEQALEIMNEILSRPSPKAPRPVTAEDELIRNLRLSFPNDILADWTREQALYWVQKNRRALLYHSKSKTFHFLRRDGFYSTTGVGFEAISSLVRDQGFPEMVKFYTEGKPKDGKATFNAKTSKQLIDEDCTIFAALSTKFGAPIKCGFLTSSKDINGLALASCEFELRTDLKPTFHSAADKYLRLFAGDRYEDFILTVAGIWEVRKGATAGAIFNGPHTCGKQMVTLAISARFEPRFPIPAAVLVAQYRGALLKGPILFSDEGLPKSTQHADASEEIRKLTNGIELQINPKYGAETTMDGGQHRLIIAVNEDENLAPLKTVGLLKEKSIDAVCQRFQYFDIDVQAGIYLESNGGMSFTQDWIKHDILVQHLMFEVERLYPRDERGERRWPPGRFGLVSGDASPRLKKILGAGGEESYDKIMDAICILAEGAIKTKELFGRGLHSKAHARGFLVSTEEVRKVLKLYDGGDLSKLSTKKLGEMLHKRFDQHKEAKQRYYVIPVHDLFNHAENAGILITNKDLNAIRLETEQ